MSDKQIKITHPEKGSRSLGHDQIGLLPEAVAKGWRLDSDVEITHPEKGARVLGPDQSAYLVEALGKGWSVLGAPQSSGQAPAAEAGAAAPQPFADVPDVASAEPVPATGSFLEQAAAASAPVLQARQEVLDQQAFARDIAEQRARDDAAAQKQQEYGAGLTTWQGLANTAATAGEGVARVVSGGLDAPAAYVQAATEQALETFRGPANPDVPRTFGESVEAAKVGIAGRHEANPLLAVGSEVVGAVGTAVATGGESLAARVLAKTPAGFAARKAAQYGGALAAKVSLVSPGLRGAFLRVAAPAVKLGVEGAVQGAAQGAGHAANRLWMDEDAHGLAEYLSAAVGGALAGGKLGAGLGAGFGAAMGARALSAGSDAYEQMARGQGLMRAASGDDGMILYPEQAQGFAKRQVAKVVSVKPEQAAKLRDEAHPVLVKKWNEYIGAREQLEELNIAAKREWARRAAPEPARFSFASVIDDEGLGLSSAHLEALANEGYVLHGNGAAGQVKLLAKRLASLDSELMADDLSHGVSHGDVVNALDQAKRDADKLVAWAETRNPALYAEMAPRVQQLRELLENEEVVGKVLADAQRKTNGTWAPAISAKMDSALDSMTATAGVKKTGSYKSAGRINDSWLTQRLNGAGSNVEMQAETAVNRMLNTEVDDALMRSSVYGSKESQAAAKRVAELRDEIQAEMGGIAKLNRAVDTSSAQNMTVLGTEVPLSGYVTESARNRIAKWAHKATVSTEKRVESAAKLSDLLDKGAPVAIANAARQKSDIAAGLDRYWQQMASGDADRENERYVAMLDQAFGPDMANAERARFTRQQQFLMSRAGDPKSPLFRTRFMKYAEPALQPLEAIERVASGTATPEDKETLQALHPQLFQRFQQKALETMDKSETTYDQKIKASRALGVPLVPELEPGRYAQIQMLAAASPSQQPQAGQGRAPDVAGMFEQ